MKGMQDTAYRALINLSGSHMENQGRQLKLVPGMQVSAEIHLGIVALPRVAQQGGKLPETINGKLAVRLAMRYDALANLHQQLGRVLASVSQQRAASGKP